MRHGPVSPEHAREMQRKRILDAMVSEVGERGLRSITIAGVSARAGVSRSTFYGLFDDLDACVLAVLRQVASRSTALMSKAFADEPCWQDGVLAALTVLLQSLDREPLLARVCLLEMLAGSPAVLEHRARELAALNPLVDVGRKQVRAKGEPVELTAEASVASVAGILHTRLVTGEAPPFIGLLGQLVGLVVCPYLDPYEVVREIKRGEALAQSIVEKHASSSSLPPTTMQLPAVLRHPGAFRARSCVTFIAANQAQATRQSPPVSACRTLDRSPNSSRAWSVPACSVSTRAAPAAPTSGGSRPRGMSLHGYSNRASVTLIRAHDYRNNSSI